MTCKRGAAPRARFWLRIATTVVLWIFLVTYVHSLAHQYKPEILDILNSPMLQITATTVLLTVLVYLLALSLPFVSNPRPRGIGVMFVWAVLLVGGHSLSHMGFHDAQAMLATMRDAVGVFTLLSLALAYAVALAMPFVPGMELGLLIMAVFGPLGAIVAYAATIGGLSLVFAIGRVLPNRVTEALLERVGVALPRGDMASAMQGMIAESRLGRSVAGRLVALLFDHRNLTLAVCLNLPGNSALGGGGGIALLCGLSRQFGWRSYLLTVAIATSPVPILVLTGLLNMEPLMEHHGFVHDALTRIESLFIHD